MFPQDVIDSVMVILMFVLRIGVPIALTLAFGYWLENKLRPPEQAENSQPVQTEKRWTRTGNIIQLHCWDVKKCDAAKRAQCAATKHPELPCWLALQAEGQKVREECFTCAFYKPQTKAA
jgi:hypothetical protein